MRVYHGDSQATGQPNQRGNTARRFPLHDGHRLHNKRPRKCMAYVGQPHTGARKSMNFFCQCSNIKAMVPFAAPIKRPVTNLKDLPQRRWQGKSRRKLLRNRAESRGASRTRHPLSPACDAPCAPSREPGRIPPPHEMRSLHR